MGVVAHPQGSLAHSTLFPVGFEGSLAMGLGGEGIEMGAHLWTEGERVSGHECSGARPGGSPSFPGRPPTSILE